jgi:hypothetical protein
MKTLLSVKALSAAASFAAFMLSTGLFDARARAQVAGPHVVRDRAFKPAWLEGAGGHLQIKLAGEILDTTGLPADDCKLTVTLKTAFSATNLPVEIQRNRFHVSVTVGAGGWFNVHLNAASSDGQRMVWETISAFELRQAAIDGIKMTLKPPERFLEVTVVENGGPVRAAFVVAEVADALFTAKTNGSGVASFPLLNRDKLSRLTAWTDDFRIGGYSFYRDPPRDPSGSTFTIELVKCRPQVIRIIDEENKAPIRDLAFVLTVGTGPPNYQFLGEISGRAMRTNDKGEAVYRWFPDWKTHGAYVEIPDPRWAKASKPETVGGAILVKVRKSRFETRRRVVGQLTSALANLAGFYVEMWSFQGEEEHVSDALHAFTDENGTFAAEYLPGSTYCICVNDARHVSNIIDLIPYDPVTHKTNAPSLTVSEGQAVEVAVTSGRARAPVAHQWIQLETPHDYSWHEDGTTHNGRGSRRWWVTTDEQGKARTIALPGAKIQGSLYTPEWRSEVSADVKTDGVTRLEFHREVADAREITGRLLLAGDVAADLNGAVIEIGSVDGETHERMTRKANVKGEFSFKSKASCIGIYARTKDARAATVAVVEHPDQPVVLKLKLTGEFRGQLLGEEDRPLKGHAVRAAVPVGKSDFSKSFPTQFLAASFNARTDGEGNYSFSGLPCETPIKVFAGSLDGSGRETSFGWILPGSPRIASSHCEPVMEAREQTFFRRALRGSPARLPFVEFRRHGHSLSTG